MNSPLATVVVTPREQFSKARRCLKTLVECTDSSVPVIYVDGNSPRSVARFIREQASQRGFNLLRSEQYISSNQARNMALSYVRTKYVAFVDNDACVTPGWLDRLIACAEETGAWAVGPLYLIDEPAKEIIHMFGADLRILENGSTRRLHESHHFSNVPVARVREELVRQQTNLVEFHCMLVRTGVFERLGPLDERLISFLDHVDFCLNIAEAGGTIFLEPTAVVAHLAPPPYALYDLPYFFLRFSDAWMESSVRHFAEKHDLQLSDVEFNGHRRFRNAHRLRLLGRVRGAARKLTGQRGLGLLDSFFTNVLCDRVIERGLVHLYQPHKHTKSV